MIFHSVRRVGFHSYRRCQRYSWPAHSPVCMWFDYGILNDFLKEWVVRKDELKSGKITRDEYFEWKINWPYTCDGCGEFDPKKQWRLSSF